MKNKKRELPEGWRWEKLDNIGRIVTGSTPSRSEEKYYGGNIPWIKPEDLDKELFVSKSLEYLTEEGAQKARILPRDAILVSCIGNIGKMAIAKTSLTTNQQINALIVENSYTRYIFYALKNSMQILASKANQALVPIINASTFSQVIIPLPPTFDNQIAIANELERKMTEVGKMRRAALRQKEAIVAMQGAILREVFCYKDGDKLPEGWKFVEIRNVIENNVQVFNPEDYGKERFSYIDISSVDNISKKILKSNQIFVKEAPSRAKSILKENDIIISTVRPNLNAVALANRNHNGHVCSSGFCVIRLKSGYYAPYFFHYFISPYFVETVSKIVQGAMYPAINDDDVKNFSIPLPPTHDDQITIANELERKIVEVDKIRQAADRQLEAIEALPGAILREVFDFEGK